MKNIFISFMFLITTTIAAQHPVEFRAVKLTNVDSDVLFSDQNIAEAMDYLSKIGINTILTVVWNGHQTDGVYTLYPSAVMENLFGKAMYPLFARGRDPLERVIIEAHRNGIEVFPWFEMGFSPSYSQNGGHILQRFPTWALENNAGELVVKNGFDWMSAINPEVQEFIISLVTEIVDNYDVDGIEFSDRIPAMPVEGGYDLVTRSIYQNEHNGNNPPNNYRNPDWMRWRADKLSEFNSHTRDSIKIRAPHVIFSSSPSVYPWSYQEYLQDSKTWVEQDIVDNIIPQVYRYNYSDYFYELNQSLSFIPSGKRDIFFSGMLIKVGGYTISPAFFLNSIQANRDRNVFGEAFFFYEGLRDDNDFLGDTLKSTYYSEPALLPHRSGNIWRAKATIVNEDDEGAEIFGEWDRSNISGFKPNVLIKKDSEYAAIHYYFDVPFSAWFDVFAYVFTGPLATTQAPFTVYSESDSFTVLVDQTNYYNKGWQPLKSVYLNKGRHNVLKLDNSGVPAGQFVVADAAMIMINRKLSPDVIVTRVAEPEYVNQSKPLDFVLYQNYPNPFNNSTIISFVISKRSQINIKIFDVNGRMIEVVANEIRSAGRHEIIYHADHLASGIYLYRLQVGNRTSTRKFILIR